MLKVDRYELQVRGKAYLMEPLEIDNDYKMVLEGSITGSTDTSLQNGTVARTYKFEPATVEILSNNGKRIKSQDPKSYSQRVRLALQACHRNDINNTTDFEVIYANIQQNILRNVDKIYEKYKNVDNSY